MTLIDDWHETYLKHYVVKSTSQCAIVGENVFKNHFDIGRMMMGGWGRHVGGVGLIFVNILYENVLNSKSNL